MFILVTYDVNTESESGKRRLRHVAKQCMNYGTRVQNSVFECVVSSAQCSVLKKLLEEIIDKEKDSIRIYYLGSEKNKKVEHMRVNKGIDLTETLMF